MQTKDPKTLVTYRITLDSFEGFLKDNNYTITQETAEDIVQGYVNWFNHNQHPKKTELTALRMSDSTGGEAIFNNISPAGDETFNVSTFCETCSTSFIVRTTGGVLMFDGKSWAGTLADGNFELKGIIDSDDTGNGYIPSSFTLSGACGENSNVSLETDSGWSGSFTANVACV